MEKYAFKMRLKAGCAEEYRRRHDTIWPKLVDLLRVSGVRDYSIYLDEASLTLFGVLWRSRDHRMAQLSQHELMREWWDYMADLMEVHPDNEPVAAPLPCMFHLE
ncbi:L-rhamnose mutarotase [Niveibacterium sp. SC-1]|uniref:L-rhamnose mutarotase n=1 Tax=Niveibacterium sp. SC-1 TaxID=3135646 RepID=UPI00311FFE01